MKVFTTKPNDRWISPYVILEKVFFWKGSDWVYDSQTAADLADKLEPACQLLQKIRKKIRPDVKYVKIDAYDTWSLDRTLAPIIAAGLIKLKEEKHGVPMAFIYDTEGNENATVEEGEVAWDEALDSMIWSFTEYTRDWEDDYMSGEIDMQVEKNPEYDDVRRMVYGPAHTFEYDIEGAKKHREKIQYGIDLFAKHFESLWS